MDHHLLLLLELLMTLVDSVVDPIVESGPDHRVDDVAQVLSRDLPNLLLDGQVREDLRVVGCKIQNPFNFEAIVLGDHDDPDVVVLEDLLLP